MLMLFTCFLESSRVYLVNIMHTWNIDLCPLLSRNHVTFEYKKLITACWFNLYSWHLVTRLLTLNVFYKNLTVTYKISILNFILRLEYPLPPIGYLMHLVGVDVVTLTALSALTLKQQVCLQQLYSYWRENQCFIMCVAECLELSESTFYEILAVQLHSL